MSEGIKPTLKPGAQVLDLAQARARREASASPSTTDANPVLKPHERELAAFRAAQREERLAAQRARRREALRAALQPVTTANAEQIREKVAANLQVQRLKAEAQEQPEEAKFSETGVSREELEMLHNMVAESTTPAPEILPDNVVVLHPPRQTSEALPKPKDVQVGPQQSPLRKFFNSWLGLE